MKKIKSFILALFVMSISILSVVTVNAETLPVKSAWILHSNCIVVLRENGDLLLGNSIDTQTPELMAQNVKDFMGEYSSNFDTFTGFALHNNGDITKISCQQKNKGENVLEKEIMKVNADSIYSVGKLAYLNKNHELKFTYSDGVNFPFDVTLENIKKTYDAKSTSEPLYAISTDDVLYQYKISGHIQKIEETEIMTNVKDYIVNGRDLIVLRNNNDLYFIKDAKNTPERIGTNVEGLDKVAYYDTWTDNYPIDYVNKNGEYFSGSSTKAHVKYMDNVKNVYIIQDHRYVITNDNILYSFGPYHWGIDPEARGTSKIEGIKKLLYRKGHMYATDTNYIWKLGADGAVYNSDNRYYMSDVSDVVIYGTLSKDTKRYLFIKQNGELWGAFSDAPGKSFLTAFCQKPTIVKINQKEIELTAKIQMVNDRSMYPFRECLETMGATVLWDAANQIAIGEYNGITVEFPIDKSEYYINGIRHEMDTAAYIDESIGRTYIPIRYAAEGLGFTVDWIEGDMENTIDIHK